MEEGDRPYTSRYIGSLVSDFHRNMIKGGIYIYPKTSKAQNGKLRLLYECNPMSFIIEQAGGRAITGTKGRVLDVMPVTAPKHFSCGVLRNVPSHHPTNAPCCNLQTKIHERVPIFLGCKRDVDEVERLYSKHNAAGAGGGAGAASST